MKSLDIYLIAIFYRWNVIENIRTIIKCRLYISSTMNREYIVSSHLYFTVSGIIKIRTYHTIYIYDTINCTSSQYFTHEELKFFKVFKYFDKFSVTLTAKSWRFYIWLGKMIWKTASFTIFFYLLWKSRNGHKGSVWDE